MVGDVETICKKNRDSKGDKWLTMQGKNKSRGLTTREYKTQRGEKNVLRYVK